MFKPLAEAWAVERVKKGWRPPATKEDLKEEVKKAAKKGGKRRVHEEKRGGAGKEEERALSAEQIAKLLADKSEDLSPDVAYDVETLLEAVVAALDDIVNALY